MTGHYIVPAPMEQMFQLSTTGHPFWVQANKCALPVDMHLISESPELQRGIRQLLPGYSPVVHNCFENSFSLAEKLEGSGACYVEGFIFRNNLINLHAWISYRGKYFDPTLEHGYALPKYRTEMDWREGAQYIALIEMPPSKVCSITGFDGHFPFVGENAQIVPPFSRHIWGIQEAYEDQFEIKGGVFQLLMMQFSDPAAQAAGKVMTSEMADTMLMKFQTAMEADGNAL